MICASTGNTSAAAAAYAARASIACIVLLPAGKIAFGKLAQAFMYGAKVVAIDGNFDDALRLVREIGETRADRDRQFDQSRTASKGQKTAAFEIIEELGDAPDIHILPVGNAGNITAYWMGYREFHRLGQVRRSCRAWWASRPPARRRSITTRSSKSPTPSPPRSASAIPRAGKAPARQSAKAAARSTSSPTPKSSPRSSWLATNEGIFVEPASAATIAGFFNWARPAARRIVLTVTGHGLKDPDIAMTTGDYHPIEAQADLDSIRKILETPRLRTGPDRFSRNSSF